MARVLILMSTRTYKAEAFLAAAARMAVEVVVGSNRAQALSHLNPAGNLALPFDDPEAAVAEVRRFAARYAIDAALAADDDAAPLAAAVGEALGLAHHPRQAVRTTTDKLATRLALHAAGLPAPEIWSARLDEPAASLAKRVAYPCVLKPRFLSGSRGVIRADGEAEFVRAHARLLAILGAAESTADHQTVRPGHDVLVESFVAGPEVALEGLLDRGSFRSLALFDKPDPLDGPFFEETIYVTPSRLPPATQEQVLETARRAVAAFGLYHGAVHAELRVSPAVAWLLEAAPRSIGGLCSRALAFGDGTVRLEELLIRNALGQATRHLRREAPAAGVMMIPIPRAGILKAVGGVDAARAVPGVDEVRVTIAPGQTVAPPPEGSRYLGFIFARATRPEDVEEALRAGHANLQIEIEPVGGAASEAGTPRALRRARNSKETER